MAPTRALNVVITGDPKQLGIATKTADGHLDALGKSGARMGKALALGFATAGAAAAGALVVGLKKSADAAKDAEASMAKVKVIVDNAGISFDKHAKQIDKVIQAHSRLTGFDDEDLAESFANMVRTTGNLSEAFKLNGLAADIARAKGTDLAGAQSLLARVYNGSYNGVKRLGIAIEPVTKAQDALKASTTGATAEQVKAAKAADKAATSQMAIAKLQKAFGGQAEAYGKTAAGAQERFSVALENVQEKLGAHLLPIMADVTNAAANFLSQIDSGTGAGGRFAAVVSDGFGKVKIAAEALWPVLKTGGEATLGLLRTGFERAKVIVDAITPTILRLKDTITGWVRENGPAIQAFASTVKDRLTSAFNAVQGAVGSTVGWLRSNIPPAFDAVKGAVVAAFNAIKGAVSGAVQFVRGWIDKHRDDLSAFAHAWQNIAKIVGVAVGVLVVAVREAIEHVLVPVMKVALDVVKTVWPSIKKIISGVLDAIGGVIQVFSGIFTGDFGRMWDGVKGIFKGGVKIILGIVTGAAKGLLKAATGLGGVMIDGIIAGLKGLAGLLKDAIVGAIKAAAIGIPKLIGAALGGLGKAITAGIKAGFGKLNPFGDGLGDGTGMTLPTGLSGGGSLMGAKNILSPFVSMAGRFGLHTSSGLRPGAITSSGNKSWHGSGNAVDEAGTPSGMLGYFRYLKANFGSRLRELIYTPGGVGIKDGHPFQYTGQVAADHYDHVHVAFTGDGHGRTGDGLGRFDATSYGPPWGGIQGTGTTATGVNLHGSPHIYGVAVDPKVIRLGSKLKITPNPFNYSGAFTAFDTGGTIKGNRIDFYDWRGRAAQNGWGHRNVSVSTFSGSGGGSGGSSSGGSSKPRTGSSGGAPPDYNPGSIYGGSESPVPMFANTFSGAPTKGRVGSGPVKGGGTLGPDGVDPRQARLDAMGPSATEEDWTQAQIALAALTPNTDDDIYYTKHLRDLLGGNLAAAQASGDPRKVTEAAGAFKAVQDSLKSLEDATQESADNTAALAEALKGMQDELKRQTDFATSVANTSNFQLTKTLADLVSGQIVGYGVAGRAFTPGVGVDRAY